MFTALPEGEEKDQSSRKGGGVGADLHIKCKKLEFPESLRERGVSSLHYIMRTKKVSVRRNPLKGDGGGVLFPRKN